MELGDFPFRPVLKLCSTRTGSKPGISLYDQAKTSRYRLRNWANLALSSGPNDAPLIIIFGFSSDQGPLSMLSSLFRLSGWSSTIGMNWPISSVIR